MGEFVAVLFNTLAGSNTAYGGIELLREWYILALKSRQDKEVGTNTTSTAVKRETRSCLTTCIRPGE